MNTNFNKAKVFSRNSKYKDALKYYKRAMKQAKEKEEKLACHMALGDTFRMTGDFESSVENYKKALKYLEPADEAAMDASVGLALAYRAQGNHKEALLLIEKAQKYYTKKADGVGMAFVLWARGGTLRIKGDIPGALKSFTEARKLHAKLKDKPGEGYCLCGMGGTSRVLGEPDKSLAYYKEANKTFLALRDTFGTAYSHCGMGNALRMLGKLDEAREEFVRAATLYRRIGDVVSYSYTLWSLGMTHMLLGFHNMADKYFKDARSLFKKTKDPRGVIYSRLGMAQIRALHARSGTVSADAKRILQLAEKEAASHGFKVEECHARMLLAAHTGKPVAECYKALGLKHKFKAIPFNLP